MVLVQAGDCLDDAVLRLPKVGPDSSYKCRTIGVWALRFLSSGLGGS